MATWADPFELRRLLMKFTRTPAGGIVEDVEVVTFHFAKITAGAIDAGWVTADYTAVEARMDTMWGVLKAYQNPRCVLSEYRWYKDGPVFSPADRAPGPTNPSVRLTARAVAGTDAASNGFPPQLAVSVTEIVEVRKRWGRWYLPAGVATSSDTDGRIASAFVTAWKNAIVAAYNGCRADGKKPVVFSRERSGYTTARGVVIPHHVATAYEVTDIQVDNTFDVIRSRRWSGPTVRNRTLLT